MWACLLIAVLAGAPDDPDAIAQQLAAKCQTGTLIFSQGDCLAVKVFSGSRFTHCGAVVVEEGQPVVYDSMNSAGVRKTPLAEYLRLQTPSEIQVVHPKQPLSDAEARPFTEHLRSELGRKYGVKHHLTGKRANGVHCAEYCTDALLATGRIEAKQPPSVSPGSLHEGLTVNDLYTDGDRFVLAAKVDPPAQNESWCRWAWRETRDCTTGCCRQMSRWFMCREK